MLVRNMLVACCRSRVALSVALGDWSTVRSRPFDLSGLILPRRTHYLLNFSTLFLQRGWFTLKRLYKLVHDILSIWCEESFSGTIASRSWNWFPHLWLIPDLGGLMSMIDRLMFRIVLDVSFGGSMHHGIGVTLIQLPSLPLWTTPLVV